VAERHQRTRRPAPLRGGRPAVARAHPGRAGQDFSLPGLARFLAGCCEALDLADVDLVANDTGGAVAQVFAASYPERLHTLTLTNCETQDNFPPQALLPAVLAARLGLIGRLGPWFIRDIQRARRHFFGSGYQDVTGLPDGIVRAWLEPLLGTRESAREFQRLFLSLHARDLRAAGPALSRLQVPTLLVWGTGDVFFRRRWAHWLRDTIPGATGVTEIDGARLFFPDERSAELTAALRRHWDAHPPSRRRLRHFRDGSEPVERGPELAGRCRPGPREAPLVRQLSPVVGVGDPRA
jgi:pimeloyl-ACP methyl ester carboxylesterase